MEVRVLKIKAPRGFGIQNLNTSHHAIAHYETMPKIFFWFKFYCITLYNRYFIHRRNAAVYLIAARSRGKFIIF